ncbi:hypothetical protein PoB_000202200 [Plakobranchus ocellatus]|uniref:SUEL-type lectin domain-containing protein n=1 Tax=Plakobranchus ocellatus TaxID=259542 RepID=A0AAV3Y092_9GAST|nr:hypothetical protein PoB_000202200 [Plakobranchus ocellatus]
MIHENVCSIFSLLLLSLLLMLMLLPQDFVQITAAADAPSLLKNDSACYGTFNDFLNLVCDEGEHIRVTKTMYGAKPTSQDCKPFATRTHPQPECCQPGPDDCIISFTPGSSKCPQGGHSCNLVADWVNTYTHCDQSTFPMSTNYMSIQYICERDKESKQGTITEDGDPNTNTIAPTSHKVNEIGLPPNQAKGKTPPLQPAGPATTPIHVTKPVDSPVGNIEVKDNTTLSVLLTKDKHSSDVELSDSMVAAVVGGSVGMCLTLVLFIFYWGRKKRLRIVSNKQPTVWDYLLTNTFTVRGFHGYDHFSSKRSSASSDGEAGSPVIRQVIFIGSSPARRIVTLPFKVAMILPLRAL